MTNFVKNSKVLHFTVNSAQKLSDFQVTFHSRVAPAGIDLLKVNNRNTRARCEVCSKLTIKTSERSQWNMWKVNNKDTRTLNIFHRRRSGVFIVIFEHISHLALVFLLLILNKYLAAGIMLGKLWKRNFISANLHLC